MIALVMGVSGVGKTTLGSALARELGWRHLDADDYHPPENVAKMSAGTPLDDADRRPWLARINAELLRLQAEGASAVLSCSALKNAYREMLREGVGDFRIAYLHGDFDLLRARAEAREHRYMPASLLQSQFAILEPPADAVAIDVRQPPAQCLRAMREALRLAA